MINRKDLNVLKKIYDILLTVADLDYIDDTQDLELIKEYNDIINELECKLMKANENKREYINKKRQTDPMFARSKYEREKYNAIHNTSEAE